MANRSSASNARNLDCAVIGGGPAGLVAALYLGRFRRATAVFHAGKPRAGWIPELRNLIAQTRGISGQRLLAKLVAQVRAVGVAHVRGPAKVFRAGKEFRIQCGGKTYRAKKVILATGIEDLQPLLPNLGALRKSGRLRYCPVCDAYEQCRGKTGLLVADESCLRRVIFLRHFTRHLTIFLPPEARLGPKRAKELLAAGVTFVQGKLERIVLDRGKGVLRVEIRGHAAITVNNLYVELGFRVRDGAFAHLRGLRRIQNGLLHVSGEQRTSIPGIFAVGDCASHLAQVSVAAGQAAMAATAAHNDLLAEEWR